MLKAETKILATMIEGDQERTIETIDINSFQDCKETIESHSSFEGNYEDYYFVIKDSNEDIIVTVTLDFENEKLNIENH